MVERLITQVDDPEVQAKQFEDLAHEEYIWELTHGMCPDAWEHDRFVIWGRLAILGEL